MDSLDLRTDIQPLKFRNGKVISFCSVVYCACDYMSMLELKLSDINKRDQVNNMYLITMSGSSRVGIFIRIHYRYNGLN